MIASLRGIIGKTAGGVTIDVQGVGYGVSVTREDFGRLADGKEAKLYVYEHIREQGYDLFGFSSVSSKGLFEQLLGVKNVGPKVAMAVLDVGNEAAVRNAIASGDVKLLQRANGVGKRAAEQIVVELRDKVGGIATGDAEAIVTRGGVNHADEALQALMALGYSEYDAAAALQKVDPALPTEERIKQALKG